jgi:DNA-directed RNA polymerase specialized sigma24 family protein
VALHRCLDCRARRREQPVDDAPDPRDPGPTPPVRLEEAAVTRIVARALAALPPRPTLRALASELLDGR